MPKAGKNGEVSFEQAIERLEVTVQQMENRELPLDAIIEHYEQGMKLIEFCTSKLEAAEKKIEQLSTPSLKSMITSSPEETSDDSNSPSLF